MKKGIYTSGRERFMKEDELIVSKTNLKGIITYANSVFCKIADYTIDEVLNKPHNIVRHPMMPRAIFNLLWEKLSKEEEVFAYVLNCGKKGDHYWVFAHVTPSYTTDGVLQGYHSNRRKPSNSALKVIQPLYQALFDEENKKATEHESTQAGHAFLELILKEKGVTYEEFVLSI
ncbi:MAG TPA: PAS domain-containing protein [Alphaproteobacteria bacterium]|nr:PAS domain-containing protein [Alphaproteobacteria bacterium]